VIPPTLNRCCAIASTLLFFFASLIFTTSEANAAFGSTRADRDGSLLALAVRQFTSLSHAERAILEFHDVKNIGRTGDFAVCGISSAISDPSNDPKSAAEWTHDRDVRAELIRWMLVDPDALRRLDPGGLRLLGARITGALELKDARLTIPITLRNCLIPERIDLKESSIPRLDLNGSYTGEIEASGITVDNDVEIGDGFHASGEVSFSGARIGGALDARDGHFERSKVEPHPLFAQWKVAFLAGSAQIGGDVWVCCGFESFGAVFMQRAKIKGEVYAFAGRFINPNLTALDFSRSEIDGAIWLAALPPTLTGPVVNGLIDFNSAVMPGGVAGGSILIINGTRFEGDGTGGLFAFSAVIPGVVWTHNTLQKNTILNLRDCTVSDFYDDEQSWPHPGNLFIDGFTYGELGGGGRTFAPPPVDARSRLKWLALQTDFHSQPYKQLAKVLATRGDDTGANRVLIAMEDRRYKSAGFAERIYGAVMKATIGYGYRPLLAALWCFGVILLGWPVVALAKRAGVMRETWPENSPKPAPASYEPLHPFLYSLDVFLPFVDLRQQHYWWPDAHARGSITFLGREIPWSGSFVRYFLWYQIVAGWVLSAIIVAGVTGLIRHG
jgi:hypothetical protein